MIRIIQKNRLIHNPLIRTRCFSSSSSSSSFSSSDQNSNTLNQLTQTNTLKKNMTSQASRLATEEALFLKARKERELAQEEFQQKREEILKKYSKRLPPGFELPPLSKDFGHEEFAERLDRILPEWFDCWEVLSLSELANRHNGVVEEAESQVGTKVKKEIVPIVRESNIINGKAFGRGGRKRSVAAVWIKEGKGNVVVNNKPLHEYFQVLTHRLRAIEPLSYCDVAGQFDVMCITHGGGHTGQADSIRLGISRALQNWDPNFRKSLKPGGFLTRDKRRVEQKKPGQVKARKKYQWVKR